MSDNPTSRASSPEPNTDEKWMRDKAAAEDGCPVSVGGPASSTEERYAVLGPGMSGRTNDLAEAETWLSNNPSARLYELAQSRSSPEAGQQAECTCTAVIVDGAFAYAPEVPATGKLEIQYCPLHIGQQVHPDTERLDWLSQTRGVTLSTFLDLRVDKTNRVTSWNIEEHNPRYGKMVTGQQPLREAIDAARGKTQQAPECTCGNVNASWPCRVHRSQQDPAGQTAPNTLPPAKSGDAHKVESSGGKP